MKKKKLTAAALALGMVVTGIPLSGGGLNVKAQDANIEKFKGEEWFDQNGTFQVNREDAHASFVGEIHGIT